MPELPEVEAWRRQLDPLVKRSPIEHAGPAHIATLKTIQPPLSVLDGEGFNPDALREELAHLGPEADELTTEDVARILASDSRRLHSLLRDQRLIAGIGRAWANEILWAAQLSPYSLSSQVDVAETERLAPAIHDELARGLELRLAGANDEKTYRVHNKLGVPCARCGTPIARVDFEEHTIYYCPQCQTEGRVLKDRRMSRLLK